MHDPICTYPLILKNALSNFLLSVSSFNFDENQGGKLKSTKLWNNRHQQSQAGNLLFIRIKIDDNQGVAVGHRVRLLSVGYI